MENISDVCIIGAGPGGVAAAIYAKRAGMSVRIFEKMAVGGQINLTDEIDNYPGSSKIKGYELSDKLTTHLKDLNIKVEYKEITSLEKVEGIYVLGFANSEEKVKTKFVVIATGTVPRKLGLDNQDSFAGRGLSYCATCDGMFYKNKTVALVGGGLSALEDALLLSNIAEKVIVIVRKETFSVNTVLVDAVKEKENIEIMYNSEVASIEGKDLLEKINLKNNKTNEITTIKADGMFVLIGRLPNTQFLEDVLPLNKYGEIVTNENMETSLKNVYAIGDVRERKNKQIITAMNDGVNAIKDIESKLFV